MISSWIWVDLFHTVDGRNPFRTTLKPLETIVRWYYVGNRHSRASQMVHVRLRAVSWVACVPIAPAGQGHLWYHERPGRGPPPMSRNKGSGAEHAALVFGRNKLPRSSALMSGWRNRSGFPGPRRFYP